MSQKNFSLIAGIIFLLIAILHALRLLNGWHAEIGAIVIPLWVSIVALGISGYLAYRGIVLSGKEN